MSDPVAAPIAAATPHDWAWAALAVEWLQPDNLVLLMTIGAVTILLVRLQHRPDIDFSTMLRDDDGKLSFIRLAGVGCFGASTWVLMRIALDAKPDVLVPYGIAYMAVWSGSAVAVKMVEAWTKVRGAQ